MEVEVPLFWSRREPVIAKFMSPIAPPALPSRYEMIMIMNITMGIMMMILMIHNDNHDHHDDGKDGDNDHDGDNDDDCRQWRVTRTTSSPSTLGAAPCSSGFLLLHHKHHHQRLHHHHHRLQLQICSGSQDKTVRFWDLRTRGCVNVVSYQVWQS